MTDLVRDDGTGGTARPPRATAPIQAPVVSPAAREGVSSLPDAPRAALLALHKALNGMVDDIDHLAAEGDIESLAGGYEALGEFVKAARDVTRHAEAAIAELMPQSKMNLGDRYTLERNRSRSYKWDSTELLRHLVGDRLIDPDTGENVYQRLVECLPLTPSLSWRAGALRRHGTDPDAWRETTASRTTVRVRAHREDD
jgi:hypothetical protein